ncbi:MAG TPA: PstS family phosphate ABC transporter substrate-binding protein, partial [Mycobacteriales bacterium]|nr:PstS family phosphate ABC transporter substrate-binding protein [Mycobacteriales bacterium]
LRVTKTGRAAAVATGLALLLAACGGDDAGADNGSDGGGSDLSGTIQIDGSSTVAPLSEAAAELFQEENSGVNVVVGTSGTGGGFEKFCAGETDISDASRPIKDEEAAICESNGIAFEEITVANDGIAIVVNPENDWAECLTVEQLNKIWGPESTVKSWKDVDPSFPDEPLTLFGPGTDSGTFDYFTDEINGEEGASRTDYQPSEDDNVIVQGVQGSKGAMGYFGLSYVEENEGAVKAIEVDGGDGCVAPSTETVLDGTYKPLGRPLFIYPSDKALERPEVQAFLDFYIENSDDIAEQALYVPLSDEQREEAKSKIESLVS